MIIFEKKFPQVYEAWYHKFTISCKSQPTSKHIMQVMKIVDDIDTYINIALESMKNSSDMDEISKHGGLENMSRIHFEENLDNFSIWFPYKNWKSGYAGAFFKNKELRFTQTDHD